MKILLTGATGFIGSHVARELLARGHAVRAVVRPDSDRWRIADVVERIEQVPCAVFEASEDELARIAEGTELCVHAAWFAVPGEYLASPRNVACLQGSLRLLSALARAGCRRAAFVGSCFEYDFGPAPLAETSPIGPSSLYAAAKVSTFLVGQRLAGLEGISFAWPRLFYQYGPFEDPRRLVPYVIRSLLRGEAVPLTAGHNVRDYLHVHDVATAVASIALSDLEGAVNVGSGRPATVREIVTTVERLLGCPGRARFGERPENPAEPSFLCANNRRLVEGTGWAPRFDLAAGLADTIEWTKRHEGRASSAPAPRSSP